MRHAGEDYQHIQDSKMNIPEDEPVFLLRAQDKCAWETVLHWANLVEEKGGDPKSAAKARRQAEKMREWEPQKLPDM